MDIKSAFRRMVLEFFKPAKQKKIEFFSSFKELVELLKNQLPDMIEFEEIESNMAKIILNDGHNRRIVIEASSVTMTDSFLLSKDFLPFIACNGIHTSKVQRLTDLMKTGDTKAALDIIRLELGIKKRPENPHVRGLV